MFGRVFKTKSFAATARKALISDSELCASIHCVWDGQANDLGGGVWKKRLNANRHRSIILAKGRTCWIYQFLFAKQDQGNISRHELAMFRKLAGIYSELTDEQIQLLLDRQDFTEICDGK